MSDASTADSSSQLEQLTRTACEQGLRGKLLEAAATLDEAELLLGAATQCHAAAKIRFLLERGRIFCLAKTPARARPAFVEAWHLASSSGEDCLAIDAAQMMSTIEPPKMQKDWTLRAIVLAEASIQKNAKELLGGLYSTLAWHYFDLRQYDKSLELFGKAVATLEQIGAAPDKVTTAKCAVGRILRALNRIDEALALHEGLLAEMNQVGRKNGYVFEELAECLTLLKRTSEAEMYFQLAHAELSHDEWFADNMPQRIRRFKELGKVKK